MSSGPLELADTTPSEERRESNLHLRRQNASLAQQKIKKKKEEREEEERKGRKEEKGKEEEEQEEDDKRRKGLERSFFLGIQVPLGKLTLLSR